MNYRVKQSGYIGVLLILLGTAGMLFFFMRMYFTPTPSMQGGAPTTTTQLDRIQDDIGAAEAASEQSYQKALEINRLIDDRK